jgi:hypothetical protein
MLGGHVIFVEKQEILKFIIDFYNGLVPLVEQEKAY